MSPYVPMKSARVYTELSEKTTFIMVSLPQEVHTKPRRNGLVTGRSFVA